ncbi:acetyl-CoA carboxylase [Salinactinospora qingdaonensis]|uniref:Biotin carboxyl carrier protein of acetyl-CoA carboxylase n=1 Tax=Salinactinospora qingdaonensis TaxID=702744 RepID=A0ABP7F9H9_9ACTN
MTPPPADQPPSWNELLDLVARLDSSPYADVELDLPGLHLRMSTAPGTAEGDSPAPAPAVPAQPPTPPPAEEAQPAEAGSTTAGAQLVDVTAPLLGTFYRRPSPDADPFVEIGSEVTADTSVGIVEVMKMMTPVPAGVAGRVVEIRAQDGEVVEHEQVLVRIAPEGGL